MSVRWLSRTGWHRSIARTALQVDGCSSISFSRKRFVVARMLAKGTSSYNFTQLTSGVGLIPCNFMCLMLVRSLQAETLKAGE